MDDFLGDPFPPASSSVDLPDLDELFLHELENDNLGSVWRHTNNADDARLSKESNFTDMYSSFWNPNFDALDLDSGPMSNDSGDSFAVKNNAGLGTLQNQFFNIPMGLRNQFIPPNIAPEPERIELRHSTLASAAAASNSSKMPIPSPTNKSVHPDPQTRSSCH